VPSHRPNTIASDSFLNSKKDKRTIKHSAFVNRIEKSHKKPLKRRRPNKKLVTTLESLGDALNELEDGFDGNGIEERVKEGKIRLKGLKSRPGAMKRREKLERSERERFGKNMAQLTAGAAKGNTGVMQVEGQEETKEQQPSSTASRWAALRGFISQTMEQKEEFRAKV
jgi:hypothetical protein